MTPEKAEQIVAEARTWIGTPYAHMGNIKGKGGGVDCGMIIIEIMSATGVFEWFDPRPYGRQFHLHRDEEWYLGHLERLGTEVSAPSPGMVAIFKWGRLFAHGGIVTGSVVRGERLCPVMVHAYAQARFVCEEPIDRGPLFNRSVRYFDLWGDK